MNYSTYQTESIEKEMHVFLDRYLPKRKPISLDDYDWSTIGNFSADVEFMEAVAFVTLVESNPEAPAQILLAASDRSNSPWLRRFITETWLQEESMHAAPYKEYLIRTGSYSRTFIETEIKKIIGRGFIHEAGYTELQATTYGWLQELITWRFYETMREYLQNHQAAENPSNKLLVKILDDIARQENFHRHVYKTGIATILKYQPFRKNKVVKAAVQFIMPGHHMAPEWQSKAPHWATKFNFPIKKLIQDMTKGLVEFTGYRGLGQASLLYGLHNKIFFPWHLRALINVLNPVANWSYNSPFTYLTGRIIAKAF
jgi:hypothetical protein